MMNILWLIRPYQLCCCAHESSFSGYHAHCPTDCSVVCALALCSVSQVDMVQDVLVDFVVTLMRTAAEESSKRGKLSVEDLIFLVRRVTCCPHQHVDVSRAWRICTFPGHPICIASTALSLHSCQELHATTHRCDCARKSRAMPLMVRPRGDELEVTQLVRSPLWKPCYPTAGP